MDPTTLVARWGLVDNDDAGLSAPLEDRAWQRLLANVRRHRIEGLLVAALAAGWPCTEAQRRSAAETHRRAMSTALLLERTALEMADHLDEAGLRWRVLKGVASAHLDYDDPALRSFGDIDLLVAGSDIERVYALLEGIGGRRHHHPGAVFDRRFGKGAAFTLPSAIEVDVHRTLCLGPYGLAIDLDDLLSGVSRFTLATRELPALDPSWRFLHACYHTSLSGPHRRLSAVRDVAQLLPATPDDAHHAISIAERSGGVAVVARAVACAGELLSWQPEGFRGELLRWATALRPTARDRRWLAGYDRGASGSRTRTLLAAEALPTVRERVLYAFSVLGPSTFDKLRRTGERMGRS
ncbi:MAG: nucleotidyltransferase family protein [Acidimicrobiia bacterium]|nr:nucleotidyltransferase family protein [Acidimicrobiia bacterium]